MNGTYPPRTTAERVAAWFATHDGLITRLEASQLGVTPGHIDRCLHGGIWERVYPGVYHLVGCPMGSLTQLRAAVLLGGAGTAVSHRAAAWLWGLRDNLGAELTITVGRNRIVRVAGVRAVRSRHPVWPVTRRGLPCTDAVRTIVDCAADADAGEVDDLVDRALAQRITRVDELITVTTDPGAIAHHRGRPLLVERLRQRGVTGLPNPSVLESRAARLFRRHHLPQPKAEVWWGPDRRYRLDFAYPQLRLVIEVDGWAAHFAPEQQRRDHQRGNSLNRAGWTVLHYNWWEITYEADRVATEIADTYRRLLAAA
jgi:very-short-patch-repair endonuclease